MENDWRYERKFAIDYLTFEQVEDFIIGNSFLFSEIYSQRQVNNIYFDDFSYSAYHQNIEGLSERKKFRIRWYGDTYGEVKNPILEAKIKNSALGTKHHYKIVNFEMNKIFDSNIFSNIFKKSNLKEQIYNEITAQSPSLVNSYERKYYLSRDESFRITIDKNLSYFYVSQNLKEVLTKNNQYGIIVEIKYQSKDDKFLNLISNQFPFRLSRNSKYVQGFSSVHDIIY